MFAPAKLTVSAVFTKLKEIATMTGNAVSVLEMLLSEPNRRSGPSCSKLTTSLVNDSLKFTSSDTQIR